MNVNINQKMSSKNEEGGPNSEHSLRVNDQTSYTLKSNSSPEQLPLKNRTFLN